MATQLETLSEKFRKDLLTRNSYNDNGQYSSNHKNAMEMKRVKVKIVIILVRQSIFKIG
jgi:hypothetical protein